MDNKLPHTLALVLIAPGNSSCQRINDNKPQRLGKRLLSLIDGSNKHLRVAVFCQQIKVCSNRIKVGNLVANLVAKGLFDGGNTVHDPVCAF